MVTGILGKKVGMTQIFDDKVEVRPITVQQAGACVVTQTQTAARDGHAAGQSVLIEMVRAQRWNVAHAAHAVRQNEEQEEDLPDADVPHVAENSREKPTWGRDRRA